MSINPAEFDYSDILNLSNKEFESLLDKNLLIVINNARFESKKDLIRLASKVGKPIRYSLINDNKSFDAIEDTLVRTVVYNLKNISLGENQYTGRASWHIDSKWSDPQFHIRYNFLYANRLPADRSVGNTIYVSTPEMLKHMDKDRLNYLRTLTVKHARSKIALMFEGGYVGQNIGDLNDDFYVRSEPLIQKDRLGNEFMHLSSQDAWCIDGLSDVESKNLLNQLSKEIKESPFQYRHSWRPNQLLVMINAYYPHMVADDFDTCEREMWRLWIK